MNGHPIIVHEGLIYPGTTSTDLASAKAVLNQNTKLSSGRPGGGRPELRCTVTSSRYHQPRAAI